MWAQNGQCTQMVIRFIGNLVHLGRQILFNCMKVDLLLTQGLLLGGSYSKKRVSKQASGN